MIKLNCKNCGKEFYIYDCRIGKRKHCSKECYNLSLVGKIPWNKGLKLGPNPEHSKRMSGKNHWNYGKHFSQETKRKMSEIAKETNRRPPSFKGKKRSKEFCEKNRIGQLKRFKENPVSRESREKISKAVMGRIFSEETKRKISKANTGNIVSEETKKKLSEINKRKWQNPDYFQRMFRAFAIRPTKPEIFLTNFLQQILPNEYKYVGDGQFILGGKCPDFMNVNGQKKLIELYGDYWHRNDNPQDRINLFKEHGFDTLVIWESELKDNNLRERIVGFNL